MKLALFCARMSGFSGVELYTLDLALALARAGHDVSVHTENWADWMKAELSGVACLGGHERRKVDACISPKYLPLRWAFEFGVPVVQVLHSEHSTDVPLEHPALRGVVTIRKGQSFLVDAAPRSVRELPRAMIRNPIGFERSGRDRMLERGALAWDGVLVSEFDDMKVNLARRFEERLDSDVPVALVGPWRSEQKVPNGCVHHDATFDPWKFYRTSNVACSYRYSRTLPEAAWCNTPTLVFGSMEGEARTGEDGVHDWTFVFPKDVDLDAHSYARVAREWTALLERVA